MHSQPTSPSGKEAVNKFYDKRPMQAFMRIEKRQMHAKGIKEASLVGYSRQCNPFFRSAHASMDNTMNGQSPEQRFKCQEFHMKLVNNKIEQQNAKIWRALAQISKRKSKFEIETIPEFRKTNFEFDQKKCYKRINHDNKQLATRLDNVKSVVNSSLESDKKLRKTLNWRRRTRPVNEGTLEHKNSIETNLSCMFYLGSQHGQKETLSAQVSSSRMAFMPSTLFVKDDQESSNLRE